jgi:beta-lactam-binding protein with PASTA domain
VAPPAVTTAAPAPTTEAAPAATFAMPDFVGMDLQSAQDLVQTSGVWLSVSHDLLGSRNQVVDSNWLVCTQNIPAGQQVSAEADAEGEIDFGVVKREESCP